MDVHQLIQTLGQRLGLPALALDDNAACALVFGGSTQVDLSYSEQDRLLHLCSVVGVPQRSEKPALLTALLEANIGSPELGHCCFALDPTSESIVVATAVPEHDQELDHLLQKIELLVASCRYWQSELGKSGMLAPH